MRDQSLIGQHLRNAMQHKPAGGRPRGGLQVPCKPGEHNTQGKQRPGNEHERAVSLERVQGRDDSNKPSVLPVRTRSTQAYLVQRRRTASSSVRARLKRNRSDAGI